MYSFWMIGGVAILILSLWAQSRVQTTFRRFAEVPSRLGRTGAEIARMLLDARGLQEVRVERAGGFLTDHYDPRDRVLRLSEATYDSSSVAAIGVAAHEAGHALQHADRYPWLGFRSAVVPVVSIGSRMLPLLTMFVIFSLSAGPNRSEPGVLAYVLVAALAAVAVFSLITLPVEFDASKRALQTVGGAGILVGEELEGAKKVLDAAALTYVASAIAAVFELIKWASILFGGRRSSNEE